MKSLEGATATRRHIILLTDGWSSSGQYDAIIARMKAAGITLSTVGAGGGSNPFLAGLAKQGGGRFYSAENPASIPDIFLKETQQVAGQQIVEEPFHPILTSQSPILRGIDALPQLLGYNGTTAKSAAQTVLVTPRDDPLLAQWQYGLGRSVAWTSDSTGRWAKGWLGWNGFTKFFSQLVSWTFPGEETGGIEATFITEGNQTKLRVESVAEDGSPRDFYSTAVAVTTPDLTSKALGLSQVAPGRLRGRASARSIRARTSSGSRRRGRARRRSGGRSGSSRRPRPSTGSSARTTRFLATLRSATGGRAIELPADPWTPRPADERLVDRPVADAPDPGPAALAARHRAAPGVGRAARARSTRGAGWAVAGDGRWRRGRRRSRGCSRRATARPDRATRAAMLRGDDAERRRRRRGAGRGGPSRGAGRVRPSGRTVRAAPSVRDPCSVEPAPAAATGPGGRTDRSARLLILRLRADSQPPPTRATRSRACATRSGDPRALARRLGGSDADRDGPV